MIYKERMKSKMQRIYEALERRMGLLGEDRQELWAMQKGFEGESAFDYFLRLLRCACLILNDVHLRNRFGKFQMDTVLVTGEAVHLYDVKNYIGEYKWESKKLVKSNGTTIENPILKLESYKAKLDVFLER